MSRGSPFGLRLGIAGVAVVVAVACDGPAGPPPSPQLAKMREGVVARVAGDEISADTVARIASAQKLGLAEARDLAIKDALFAAEARSGGIDGERAVALAVDAALARRLMTVLLEEAERAGPVTDDELRAATALHWLELDRPEGFRTVHALARAKGKASVPERTLVDIAEAMQRDLGALSKLAESTPPPAPAEPGRPPAEDPVVERFREAANAAFDRKKASAGGADVELVVEPLPPVTPDGRVIAAEPGQFDPAFARAASRLTTRGDVGPPVVSTFGVHVIMLLERTPSAIVDADERRRLLRAEIVADRARAAHTALLDNIRRGVEIDRSADALLALVGVEK